MNARLDLPEEFSETEQREIEATALTELAEAVERRYSQHQSAFDEWLAETFGSRREAMRIVSVYTLARLWAQMHKNAETPFWLAQLTRTEQEWREMV